MVAEAGAWNGHAKMAEVVAAWRERRRLGT